MTQPKQPEWEYFRVKEGEDLKCKVVDQDGNPVPLHIRSDVVVIQPSEDSPNESTNQ